VKGPNIYPNELLKKKLKEDYKQMQEMLFSTPPPFDEIIESLQKI